jgi:hypothetical protein
MARSGPDYKTRVWLLASKNPEFFEILFSQIANKARAAAIQWQNAPHAELSARAAPDERQQ